MNKEQFIKLMTVIKERYYSLESIYDKFNELFGDVGDKFINNTSLFPIIKAISEIIGDDEYWMNGTYTRKNGELKKIWKLLM